MTNEKLPEPLPRDRLPAATPPLADEPIWEDRLARLMDAAEPRLAGLRTGRIPWWSVLGAWWRPVAGFAAAAAVALIAFLPAAPAGNEPQPVSVALAATLGDGEPATLWAALGSEADPVLASIALEGTTP